MLQIKEVNSAEEFKNLRESWNNLLERSNSDTIFLRHEWLFTWWGVFSKNYHLFILLVINSGKIVGIVPLMIVKTKLDIFPIRAVKFIGENDSDRADFIVDPSTDFVVEHIGDYLIKNSHRWDIVWLKEIIKDSPNIMRLQSYLFKNNHKTWQKVYSNCPYMTLNSNWDESWKKVKQTLRKNLGRKSRRLSEKGKVEFKRHNNNIGIELDNLLTRAISIEKKSWKGNNGVGIFHDQEHREFHKRFASISQQRGWFNMSFLSVNNETICFAYGFKYKNKYLSYSTSFDPRYSKFSPGNLLKHYLIQELTTKNVSEFDFLRGSQIHKLSWTSTAREHIQFMVFKKNFYSCFLYIFQTILKPLMIKLLKASGKKPNLKWLEDEDDKS